MSTLLSAIKSKNIDLINMAIELGALPDKNTLYYAIKTDKIDIINRVIEVGALPDKYALNIAIETGIIDIVNRVIEIGSLPNEDTLNVAIRTGIIDIVKRVIEIGSLPDKYTLNTAIETGIIDIVKRVIEIGSLPNEDTLNVAIGTGIIDIVNRVIEIGALPNENTLNVAIKKGKIDIVNRVIEIGALPNEYTLDVATETGNIDIICLVVSHMDKLNIGVEYLKKCIPQILESGTTLTKAQYDAIGYPLNVINDKPEWLTYCQLTQNLGLHHIREIMINAGFSKINNVSVSLMSKHDICTFLDNDYKQYTVQLTQSNAEASYSNSCKNEQDSILTPFTEIPENERVIDSRGFCFSLEEIKGFKSANRDWPTAEDIHPWLIIPYGDIAKFDKFRHDCNTMASSSPIQAHEQESRTKLHSLPITKISRIRDIFMSLRPYNEYLNAENYITILTDDFNRLYTYFKQRLPRLSAYTNTDDGKLEFLKSIRLLIDDDRLFASELGIAMDEIYSDHQ